MRAIRRCQKRTDIRKVEEPINAAQQRWSRNFGPVVKVDRMMKETIQNEETKEPFARI